MPLPGLSRRVRNLDVLRGAAVVLVLGRHMGVAPLDAPAWLQGIMDVWVRAGWAGVDLFFVLSGFLVSGLLFREYQHTGRVDVSRFLVRRGFRIYPAFYAFLLATSLASGTFATRRFAAEALLVQNYVPGLWDHTWSLAVEEHFYFLLAAIVALLARSQRSQGIERRDPFAILPQLFASVAVAALAARILTALYGPAYFTHHLYPTHLRLDSLLFGVLLAYLADSRGTVVADWVRAHRPLLVLSAISCLAPTLFWPPTAAGMETIGLTAIYVGFGAVLLLALPIAGPQLAGDAWRHPYSEQHLSREPARRSDGLFLRVMRGARRHLASGLAWIGVYSYSIYLWHLAVKRWALPTIVNYFGWQPDTLAAFLTYIFAAILVGAVMARAVEIPSLALRARLTAAGGSVNPRERRVEIVAAAVSGSHPRGTG